MANGDAGWTRFEEDGTEWEARMVSEGERSAADQEGEIVEFVCVDGSRKPRRVALDGSVADMDEAALRWAYRQARPIGGDHYGRPGKPAGDAP